MFFKQVEGEAAVLVTRGVYTQVDLYERNGYLYAKSGTGFVRLFYDGSTTKAKTRIDALSWRGRIARDALGRLCRDDVPGSQPVNGATRQLFLGSGVTDA